MNTGDLKEEIDSCSELVLDDTSSADSLASSYDEEVARYCDFQDDDPAFV